MPYRPSSENKKIIILETNVLDDGVGDYTHLKEILRFAIQCQTLADYFFIPVIRTNGDRLAPIIMADFHAMGVTQFYRGNHDDFAAGSAFDQQLKPIYEQATQVIEVSVGIRNPQQRQYLTSGAVIKQILEHEKMHSLRWNLHLSRPTLLGSLGLHGKAYGLKIADVPKVTPMDFFSSLSLHDSAFMAKLLKTTSSKTIHQFMAENSFSHAYFNQFDHKNGFSRFLALLCSHHHDQLNVVVHLSSKKDLPLDGYLRRDKGDNTGINSLLMLFKKMETHSTISRIEFFGPENDKPNIIEINPHKSQVMRVYNAYLSQPSYELVFGASFMVGVSGDNTFEQSVSYQILPFYHSTNWSIKLVSFQIIKDMIETEDFGFTEECKKDLILYFGYEAEFSGDKFLKKLFNVDLNSLRKAWTTIATHIKINKNFYNIFERIILLPTPSVEELSTRGIIPLLIGEQNHTISPSKIPALASMPSFFTPRGKQTTTQKNEQELLPFNQVI